MPDPRTKRLYDPRTVPGRVPADTSALIEAMGRKGFWSVMEGKRVEQFLVGIAPVRWWLPVEPAKRKYGKEPRDGKKTRTATAGGFSSRFAPAAKWRRSSPSAGKTANSTPAGWERGTVAWWTNSRAPA